MPTRTETTIEEIAEIKSAISAGLESGSTTPVPIVIKITRQYNYYGLYVRGNANNVRYRTTEMNGNDLQNIANSTVNTQPRDNNVNFCKIIVKILIPVDGCLLLAIIYCYIGL